MKRVDFDCDIYVTGSNAKLLSGELATLLAGRYAEIRVYPLSFAEYLDFIRESDEGAELSEQENFINYLRYGGLPGIHQMKWEDIAVSQYLLDIYQSVLLRDVIRRNQIRDPALLENIVFLELRRRGYNVAVGKQGAAEIDFIAEKADERIYIQVCYLLTEENMEREFGPLEAISDNYEKVVLSMDSLMSINRGGIRQKNLVEFLLKEKEA